MRWRTVRFCFTLAFVLCCIVWPAAADPGTFQPIVRYTLPADIMKVEFANETWIYRLYEDGTVRKIVNQTK